MGYFELEMRKTFDHVSFYMGAREVEGGSHLENSWHVTESNENQNKKPKKK
jgi:hypothetical protein